MKKNNYYEKMYKKYKKFIYKNWSLILPNVKRKVHSEHKQIYFWVTPWLGTPLPWFIFVLAQIYAKLYNQKVKIVINDMIYESSIVPSNKELKIPIDKTVSILRKNVNIEIIFLSELENVTLSTIDQAMLDCTVNLNTIKTIHTSMKSEKYYKLCKEWRKVLEPVCEKINAFIAQSIDGCIIVPGGIFAETGYLLKKCISSKISVYTFDSGEGRFTIGIDSVAAQNGFDRYHQYIDQSANKEFLIEEAKNILDVRLHGKEDISNIEEGIIIQTGKLDENKEKYDILICTNLEDDSAALGTHRVFVDDYEWLTETVQYILDYTPYSVAVREHPMQRLFSKITMMGYLKKFETSGRFRLITFGEKVNTYALALTAKIVIVNTSTIGIEAAMLGKRVMTESDAYYSNTPFVFKAYTKKDYFDYLQQIDKICLEQSKEAMDCACIYYGLSQMYSWANTQFLPSGSYYDEWSKKTIKDILNDKDTKLIFKAIRKGVPIALLKYKERYNG